jgi:hypothetical protein
MAMYICQAKVTALVAVSQALVIDAQTMQDGGVEIVNV